MTRRIRAIISILAAVAFLITAPLVVLRTIGYGFDIKKGKVEQTGVLVVDSAPDGAAVILDGRATGDVTPARIRNLPPKRYEVRLETAGYHPWQKSLEISSAGVTFAEDVILFPMRQPARIVEGPVLFAALSPDGAWMAYVTPGTPDEVWVRNQRNGERVKLLDAAEPGSAIEWSSRADRLLVSREVGGGIEATAVVLPPGGPVVALSEILGELPSSAHWSIDDPTQIEVVAGGGIMRVDPVARRSIPLAALDGREARVYGSVVYEIRPTLTAAVLSARLIADSGRPRDIITIPSLSFRIGEPRFSWLPLSDQTGERILVAQTKGPEAEPLSFSATSLAWSPRDNAQELLFWNPFELWIADPLSRTSSLLTRLGVGLEDAAWNHDGTNVYFTSGGKLEVIERDDRGGRNSVTLAQMSAIREIIPSPDGHALFFLGTNDGQTGIFELDLR